MYVYLWGLLAELAIQCSRYLTLVAPVKWRFLALHTIDGYEQRVNKTFWQKTIGEQDNGWETHRQTNKPTPSALTRRQLVYQLAGWFSTTWFNNELTTKLKKNILCDMTNKKEAGTHYLQVHDNMHHFKNFRPT